MTWIFDGYEVSILSLASLDLKKEFGIGSLEIGYLASSYLIGCCVGALLFGNLASKFGRKTLFSVTLIIYLTSVLVQCFANHYYYLIVCRVFTGYKFIDIH
jgi:MFS family permease